MGGRKGSVLQMRNAMVAVVLLVSGMSLATASPAGSFSAGPDTRRSGESSPITINGDVQLMSMASSEGWRGTGKEWDPVIIAGLVYREDGTGACMEISNTVSHVIIRNSYFSNRSMEYGNSTDDTGYSVILVNVENVVLDGCTFADTISGVVIRDSSHITVCSSVFLNCTSQMILCDESLYITIKDCEMRGSGNGIYLKGCNSCSARENRFFHLFRPMVLWESNGNEIIGNIFIRGVENGVHLISSNGNTILENSFCYNSGTGDKGSGSKKQAYDNTGNNTWFGVRGNHWRDLTGPDDDGDGIVDVEYRIGGNLASDRGPLRRSPNDCLTTPPQNLTIERNGSDLELRWERPVDMGMCPILGYQVLRAADGEEPEILEILDGSALSTRDSDLTHGSEYQYEVRAINRIGISEPSQEAHFIWDVRKPTFHSVHPRDGSYITTPFVDPEWEVTDDIDRRPTFEVKIDNGDWEYAGDTERFRRLQLGEGEHRIGIRACDDAGNMAGISSDFTVDYTAPHVTMVYPMNGGFVTGREFPILLNISDSISGILSCMISIDERPFFNHDPEDEKRNFMFEEGRHDIEYKVEDLAGNIKQGSVSFYVSYEPPSLDIIEPLDRETIGFDVIIIRWDLNDHSEFGSVSLCMDEGKWWDVTGESVFRFRDVRDGEHRITLRGLDNTGVNRTETITIAVDTTAPVIKGHGYIPWSGEEPGWIWFSFDEKVDPDSLYVSLHGREVLPLEEPDGSYRIQVNDSMDTERSVSVSVKGADQAGNCMDVVHWRQVLYSAEELTIGTIGGQVVSMEGESLVNATVNISGVYITRTSLEGRFMMDIPQGDHTGCIECEGFEVLRFNFTVTAGQLTTLGKLRISEEKDQVGSEEAKIPRLPLVILVMAVTVVLLVYIVVMYVRKSEKKEKETRERECRDSLYDMVEIPQDLAAAFTQHPSPEDEAALLGMITPDAIRDMDGEIVAEDSTGYSPHEFETEEVSGLDLSFLDDEAEEMDWKELANPLYQSDPDEEISFEEMDCYWKLGIKRDATREDIRKAYRRLAALYHPDRISRFDRILRERAVEEMKRINYAKEILLNEGMREQYDQRTLNSATVDGL